MLTRMQAFHDFLDAVNEAIPEFSENWTKKREAIRNAGLKYANAAAFEAIKDYTETIANASV